MYHMNSAFSRPMKATPAADPVHINQRGISLNQQHDGLHCRTALALSRNLSSVLHNAKSCFIHM